MWTVFSFDEVQAIGLREEVYFPTKVLVGDEQAK